MIQLSDRAKKFIKDELREYLESDDMWGVVNRIIEVRTSLFDTGPYDYSEELANIAPFLLELGVPLFDGMGDAVSKNLFSWSSELTSVSIPSHIKYIEKDAFYDCANLRHVQFEEGLKHILQQAFHVCPNLTEIVLPASLESLGNDAFAECIKLKSVTFKSDVDVGRMSFYACSITDIFVPKDLYVEGTPIYEFCQECKKHSRVNIHTY